MIPEPMDKATCKFCWQPFEVEIWGSGVRLPRHNEPGTLNACEGTMAPVAIAAVDYDGPTEAATFGKISNRRGTTIAERMEKDRRRSAVAIAKKRSASAVLPSWYDKEELDEWDSRF